jgi:hypothetical protein
MRISSDAYKCLAGVHGKTRHEKYLQSTSNYKTGSTGMNHKGSWALPIWGLSSYGKYHLSSRNVNGIDAVSSLGELAAFLVSSSIDKSL